MNPPPLERRKSDLADDPIDEEILREIREAKDDAEKRRLMIDYGINRQLWRLGSLVSEISDKIARQDARFEEHRTEIKLILTKANEEYQAHRGEFMKHAADEEQLITQGQTAYRTAIKISAGVATLILSLGYYIINIHIAELREAQTLNVAQNKELTDLQRRLDLLDAAFSRHLISGTNPQPEAPAQTGLKLPSR